MDAPRGYDPEPGDLPLHRWDRDFGVGYFSVGTRFGVGQPYFYVALDEDGGERSWWLEPDQAEALGARLIEFAVECRSLNAEESARQAELLRDQRDVTPPS